LRSLSNPNPQMESPAQTPLRAGPLRLLLLDEHALFRRSLSRFLASEPGFEIAGECDTCDQALELVRSTPVEIVLLNAELGWERGHGFMSTARSGGYNGRFFLIAGTTDARFIAQAFKFGAAAIFLNSEGPERLAQALRLVAEGEMWIDSKVIQMLAEQLADRMPQIAPRESDKVLNDREQSVLLGIIGGLTNRKIGENLRLSESSVKNVIQRLFGKAGVKTRSQLVRVALEGSLGMTRKLIENHRKPGANLSAMRHSRG
jgi:two-component system, NarL family, nitrate/nitrite response regulator NarL